MLLFLLGMKKFIYFWEKTKTTFFLPFFFCFRHFFRLSAKIFPPIFPLFSVNKMCIYLGCSPNPRGVFHVPKIKIRKKKVKNKIFFKNKRLRLQLKEWTFLYGRTCNSFSSKFKYHTCKLCFESKIEIKFITEVCKTSN